MSELKIIATRLSVGAISVSNSSILAPSEASEFMNPVMLPPGRERLLTNPGHIGSATTTNIGMVRVSGCSAAVPGVPCVRMTSGCRATNSFAKVRVRLTSPPPHRMSIQRLRSTIQPSAANASVKAESWAFPSGSFSRTLMSTPSRFTPANCCAGAPNGHAAAVPPRRVMKSRRFN